MCSVFSPRQNLVMVGNLLEFEYPFLTLLLLSVLLLKRFSYHYPSCIPILCVLNTYGDSCPFQGRGRRDESSLTFWTWVSGIWPLETFLPLLQIYVGSSRLPFLPPELEFLFVCLFYTSVPQPPAEVGSHQCPLSTILLSSTLKIKYFLP